MTAYTKDLVVWTWKSQRAHGIVMAVVIAAALVPATALFGRVPSDVPPSACRPELVMIPMPVAERAMMPQSLGYLEFDWASTDGGVPGFALLADNSN